MMDFKQSRLKLGLTQTQMAVAMGVHRQTWVKWEREEREPDAAAIRLLEVLLWIRERRIFIDYVAKFILG